MKEINNKKINKSWQKTTIPEINKIERKWFCINLKKNILGRVAVTVSEKLRGKQKKEFTGQLDIGDYVVLLNARYISVTGKNKPTQKNYYNYSGYIGGLKKRNTKTMIETKPKELIFRVVKGMVPHNKLGRKQMKRLFIFNEEKHNLQAQQKQFIYL